VVGHEEEVEAKLLDAPPALGEGLERRVRDDENAESDEDGDDGTPPRYDRGPST